jgi:hypothetical protein
VQLHTLHDVPRRGRAGSNSPRTCLVNCARRQHDRSCGSCTHIPVFSPARAHTHAHTHARTSTRSPHLAPSVPASSTLPLPPSLPALLPSPNARQTSCTSAAAAVNRYYLRVCVPIAVVMALCMACYLWSFVTSKWGRCGTRSVNVSKMEGTEEGFMPLLGPQGHSQGAE